MKNKYLATPTVPSYLKQLMTVIEMINGRVGNNSSNDIKSLSNITLRCITHATVILRRRSRPGAPSKHRVRKLAVPTLTTSNYA